MRELVLLVGLLHVAGLGNLLPGPGADGVALFGRAWTVRPRWLGQVLQIGVPWLLVLVAVGTVFPAGFVRARLGMAMRPAIIVGELLIMLVVVALGAMARCDFRNYPLIQICR